MERKEQIATVIVQIKSLYSIKSFEDSIGNFPKSSTITLNKANEVEVMEIIKNPPLFTPVWLVIVSTKLTPSRLQKLLSYNLFILINCNSKKAYEDEKENLMSIKAQYRLIDNSRATKEELITYCMKELKINRETAEYLCKRQKYILGKVVNAVMTLVTFDIINKKVIKEYTTRMQSVSLLDLVEYMLGIGRKRNYKSLVSLVYDYKYGFKFLLEFTEKELKNRLDIYNLITAGYITTENYKIYLAENKLKYNSYFVFRVLEDYKHLSYDKLYLIHNAISNIPSDRSSIYKYLKLLELGGNLIDK